MKADPLRGSENQGNQYLLPVGRMGTAQGSQGHHARQVCTCSSMYSCKYHCTCVCRWGECPITLSQGGRQPKPSAWQVSGDEVLGDAEEMGSTLVRTKVEEQ